MNGNFEFQKQMANERVQAALMEADEHLRSQDWHRRSLVRTLLTQLLLGGAGLILIVLLLVACTPVTPAMLGEGSQQVYQDPVDFPLPYSLDDLMDYYAPQREASEAAAGSPVQSQPTRTWSMADRILFHDRLQDGPVNGAEADIPEAKILRRWGLEHRY